jgi:HEAT repeat protein
MLAPPPLPRTLEASLRDLGSAKAQTRASAIGDLVRHARGDEATRKRALPLLEKALKDDASGVRSAAAVALGDLVANEALGSVLVAIEDPDVHVRQMALNALGEIGDSRAAPRLRRALADARPEVRYQAVIAFARVAEPDDVVAALEKATKDDDDAVRYIALRLAEERVTGAAIPDATSAAPTSAAPASPGTAPWARLAPRAEELLSDKSDHVKVAAAIFLAKLGNDAGRTLVVAIVRGEGKSQKEDEREAVEIAGELGLRELVPDLERRAWGAMHWVKDTCPFHAKIALARLGHERAIAEIESDLASHKKEAVTAAVVAAGRARLTHLESRIARLSESEVDPDLRAAALADLARGARPPKHEPS